MARTPPSIPRRKSARTAANSASSSRTPGRAHGTRNQPRTPASANVSAGRGILTPGATASRSADNTRALLGALGLNDNANSTGMPDKRQRDQLAHRRAEVIDLTGKVTDFSGKIIDLTGTGYLPTPKSTDTTRGRNVTIKDDDFATPQKTPQLGSAYSTAAAVLSSPVTPTPLRATRSPATSQKNLTSTRTASNTGIQNINMGNAAFLNFPRGMLRRKREAMEAAARDVFNRYADKLPGLRALAARPAAAVQTGSGFAPFVITEEDLEDTPISRKRPIETKTSRLLTEEDIEEIPVSKKRRAEVKKPLISADDVLGEDFEEAPVAKKRRIESKTPIRAKAGSKVMGSASSSVKRQRTKPNPKVEENIAAVPGRPYLQMLPVEIRYMIYAHLLKAPDIITTKKHWTERFARDRPNMHPAILRTCKQIYHEAAPFMYGNNNFQLLLREIIEPLYSIRTSPSRQASASSTPRATRGRCNEPQINLHKYGEHIRYLEIFVERNRTGPEYKCYIERALTSIGSGRGCLNMKLLHLGIYTAPRFEVNRNRVTSTAGESILNYNGKALSVADWFSKDGAIRKALDTIDMKYLTVSIDLEGSESIETVVEDFDDVDDSDNSLDGFDEDLDSNNETEAEDEVEDSPPRRLETTIDMKWLQRPGGNAEDTCMEDPLANDIVALQGRAHRAIVARSALDNLRVSIQKAVMQPNSAVESGFWKEGTVRHSVINQRCAFEEKLRLEDAERVIDTTRLPTLEVTFFKDENGKWSVRRQ